MSDDLISRQAAIDAFDGVKVDEKYCTEYDIGYNDGIDLAVSRLSVLPSAQRWIPCSERLPIRPDYYFVTVKMKYSFEKEWQYFTDVAGNYGKDIDNFWETCNDWDEGQEVHIIAWMPLPDPWEEEAEL